MFKGFEQGIITPKKEKLDLDAYRKSGEDFINGHRRLFNSFAEDVSLKFRMADAFQIEYENGVINLDSKWFFEKGYNKEQILWATFHELSHFRDLIQDKKGLLDSFKYIQEKAEILSKESGMNPGLAYKTYHTLFNCLDDIYVNKVVARRASFYENGRQGGKHVEELYREKLFSETNFTGDNEPNSAMPHHLQFAFYLLRKSMLPQQDIKVSNEVQQALETRISIDGKSYTPEEIVKMFMLPNKQRDTKASVRHTYLKKYIEPIYESLIKKDVEDAKNAEDDENGGQEAGNNESSDKNQETGGQDGENNSSQDDKKNPGGGESGQEKSEGQSSGEQTSEEKKEKGDGGNKSEEMDEGDGKGDKSEGEGSEAENQSEDGQSSQDNSRNESGSESQGKPRGSKSKEEIRDGIFKKWSDIHDKFESNSPDQLDEKEIEKFLDHQDEEKKKEEQRKKEEVNKPKEKSRDIKESADQNWANENKIEGRDIFRELQSLRKIEESIMPYLNNLTELWQNIIAGNSIEIGYARDNAHASGAELNIDSVVDNMGAIYAGQSSPRIYDRITTKESVVEKPEIIRVRLVVDKSGSMDNEVKQRVLAQALVLILRSLQQFNEMLDLTRGSTGSKLRVETEVLGFSDKLSIIKKLESEVMEESDPTVEILNTLKRSGYENGRTYDHLALNHVINKQDEVDKQRIKQGKILDILFEITDGGSSNEESSLEAVKKIDETGIHANAFQIGRVSESEKRAFNYAWNSIEDRKKGLIVGEEIERLLPAVTVALKKYLGGVHI